MKIICSQEQLKNNLSLVSRVVPSRPTHPILGNVLLVADKRKNEVTVTGFDLTVGIQSSFPAGVEEGGVITLPAKLLNDVVSRLPDGEIIITYEEREEEENPLVGIHCLGGRFQLRGMRGDEYPPLPLVRENGFHLPGEALTEGLKGCLFAASNDETKQILTGVHLKCNDNTIEFAATDGHRLAVVREKVEEEEVEGYSGAVGFEITIPARGLRELERILSGAKEGEKVELCIASKDVAFRLRDVILTSRRLEGAYPDYSRLIPNSFQKTMAVERKRLIDSLERLSVFSDQKNSLVRFRLNPTSRELTVAIEAGEIGSGKESMTAEISGEGFEIGFNIKYLLEGLKAFSSHEVKFHFNGPVQPVVVTPLDGTSMTYLIMPVQI
ncbi:MAG: DNA polymerase III subunit beta [Geminocystis sp.]|nr:DNA polymerase III subunit beta [Geminocystis sp.]HIK37546.1 DNA polymerase III subunit beta [Geminocystis sp. M7585_C2015_104]MCS7146700.1 DNA polymerase III subunit beta [Geminocystis sp.]MCX8077150.1 DNA polymerase III subunit beta [Geminocystis sp.]MDW8115526.1 DNA polymerase III subunit beta [Geminocystis sp.]